MLSNAKMKHETKKTAGGKITYARASEREFNKFTKVSDLDKLQFIGETE